MNTMKVETCSRCGTCIEDVPQVWQDEVVCASCRAKLETSSKCSQCGVVIEEPGHPLNDRPVCTSCRQKAKSAHFWKEYGVCAALAVVLWSIFISPVSVQRLAAGQIVEGMTGLIVVGIVLGEVFWLAFAFFRWVYRRSFR